MDHQYTLHRGGDGVSSRTISTLGRKREREWADSETTGLPSSDVFKRLVTSDDVMSSEYDIPFGLTADIASSPPQFSGFEIETTGLVESAVKSGMNRPGEEIVFLDKPVYASLSSPQMETARRIIGTAVDMGKPEVDLDGMDLDSVPKDLADLKDLVVLTGTESLKGRVNIFLSNNKLESLFGASFFDVRNLTVLSLRNNKIKDLPPAVYKLVNLRELSLGGNLLTTLPYELTQLPQLSLLSIDPNPLLRKSEPSSALELKRFRKDGNIATLQALCLRVITDHLVYTARERRRLNLTQWFEQMILAAADAKTNGNRCFVCLQEMVEEGYVEVVWLDEFLGHENVPFTRRVCSGACWNAA